MQRVCDELSAGKIDRLLRKWLRRLPHPFPPRDRAVGYRYQLSILQAEFSLTQVLDQPVTGRIFFEEVICENLDIGRPSQVSLVFDRKVSRRTPGQFRTRVITDGVCRRCTSTTRRPASSSITRRDRRFEPKPPPTTPATSPSADASKISTNCARSALRPTDVYLTSNASVTIASSAKPLSRTCKNLIMVNQHRVAALRFADPRVHALLHVLLLFLLVQGTFTNKDVREHLAPLLGKKPSQLSPGQITYDLRRLRLHGLTERIPKTHRYRLTAKGLRTAIFYNRLYNRSLRTGLAIISPCAANSELPIAKSIRAAENAVNKWCQHQKLAA
jgi:hypothetical protein